MSYKTLISPLICKHFDNPNETSSSIKEQLLLHSYICHLKTTVAEAYARLSLWLTTKIRGYLISRDISHFITRFSLYCSSVVWQATTKDKMKNLSWKVEWKLQAICLWNVTTFFQTLVSKGTFPRACSLEKNKYLTSLIFGVANLTKGPLEQNSKTSAQLFNKNVTSLAVPS